MIVPVGSVQRFVLVKVQDIRNTVDPVGLIGLTVHVAVVHLVLSPVQTRVGLALVVILATRYQGRVHRGLALVGG